MSAAIEGVSADKPTRDEVRRALRVALACWPVDDEERRTIAASHDVQPPTLHAGETLLVSVSPCAERVALWLTTDGGSERETVPLVGSAAESARSMLHLAMRDHPLPAPKRLELALRRAPTVRARRVRKEGEGKDSRLDGTSFGLALGLAAASWLADVPLGAEVAALATLDGAGRTGRVDALDRKIGAILDFAQGVSTLLVAPSQVDEATTVLAVLGRGRATPSVIACGSLGEALDRVLPLNPAALAALSATEARGAVRRLFSVAVMGTPHALSWGGIASALDGLSSGPPDRLQEEDVRRARFGRAVALRHAGRQVEPVALDAGWVRGLPRPLRLKVAAHLVQDSADGAFELLPERIAFAQGLLAPPQERHGDDLRLLGALGRAEAARHHWKVAASALTEAVTGWQELDLLHEAAHPLCELLRVVGIQRDASTLSALRTGWAAHLLADPRTPGISVAFVLVALGRAEAQTGEASEALATLDEQAADWAAQPLHLRWAQLRWRARAQDALEDAPGAKVTRAAATQVTRGKPGHEEFGLLVELDMTLAAGGDGEDVVAALGRGPRSAPEIRRLRALGCWRPAEMAEVWRY